MRRPCGESRQGHRAQSSTKRVTCAMFRRVPSKSKVQPVRRAVSGFIALGLVAILVTNVPVHAVTHRYMPPEPSRLPWISAQTEQALVSAIDVYQRIVAAGGWPKLPGHITLRPGDNDENVVILRKRLKMTGDLPANARGDYAFDENVVEAVKRYQRRVGLEPTGVVYGITLRSLNVPAKTRLRQLQANLARIQELLPKLRGAPKYIIMNATSFELQGIQNGRSPSQAGLSPVSAPRRRRTSAPTSAQSISSPTGTCRARSPSGR